MAYCEVVPLSNPFGREDDGFRQGWTAFYWAWWISWSPFVGMFIARVSRGRTVREFVTCVLVIPVAGLHLLDGRLRRGRDQRRHRSRDVGGQGQRADNYTPGLSLFAMLEACRWRRSPRHIGIVLVIVFFVTSSDSGRS